MEFIQGNWFSIVMLAIVVIERAISYGVAKAKVEEIINNVAEVKNTVAEVKSTAETGMSRFYSHANDSSIHVTPTLVELLKERNDYVKNELANTRADVQRIENMLGSMMR
jgi:hypothetical protein